MEDKKYKKIELYCDVRVNYSSGAHSTFTGHLMQSAHKTGNLCLKIRSSDQIEWFYVVSGSLCAPVCLEISYTKVFYFVLFLLLLLLLFCF